MVSYVTQVIRTINTGKLMKSTRVTARTAPAEPESVSESSPIGQFPCQNVELKNVMTNLKLNIVYQTKSDRSLLISLNVLYNLQVIYRVSGIFRVGKFWRK